MEPDKLRGTTDHTGNRTTLSPAQKVLARPQAQAAASRAQLLPRTPPTGHEGDRHMTAHRARTHDRPKAWHTTPQAATSTPSTTREGTARTAHGSRCRRLRRGAYEARCSDSSARWGGSRSNSKHGSRDGRRRCSKRRGRRRHHPHTRHHLDIRRTRGRQARTRQNHKRSPLGMQAVAAARTDRSIHTTHTTRGSSNNDIRSSARAVSRKSVGTHFAPIYTHAGPGTPPWENAKECVGTGRNANGRFALFGIPGTTSHPKGS